jgi:hypothetical protein
MPGEADRPLNAEERAARQRYLLAHPGDDLRLAPTTAGFAEIADWVAAGEPQPGACPCAHHSAMYAAHRAGS